ncbi:SRPBCC domain-containing protein [Xanthovirga aplysinae]|uniref:SRPBCC domain-containing protein n=1 Tax=Xanthovirga aplysinae TaxID=2529853 RepID=UPI0012BC61A7|nr:SRPBCC domain-containing protein [Xanthovirga aplysinae]MTI32278.1 SRPBCC domain-containing protein [Xanthovirga aplysinae]
MNREYISKASIEINAPKSKVWEALVKPEIAKKYFFGAEVITEWKEGSPIQFKGEFNGNKYEEKGTLLKVRPNIQLQYTHWSNLEGIPDKSENYRIWTFDIMEKERITQLTVSEDNIPTEKKRKRSNEFWNGVLLNIKQILEN